MQAETVSVIVPTFRATKRLGDAIDSLLRQTYPFVEIIIVDDNQPDSESRSFTENIIGKYAQNNLVYIKHDCNKNGSAARNTGLKASQGGYITFLDDDDVFYPQRLERCVDFLSVHRDYDVVYTDCDIYKEDVFISRHIAKYSGFIWKELLISQAVLGTGSNLFFRRECLDSAPLLDERFLRFQDIEFAIRLSEKHAFFALNESLVRKNVENTNLPSFNKLRENRELIFDTFDYLIKQLSPAEKASFFDDKLAILYLTALASKDKKAFSDTIKMQAEHVPNWKSKLKCLFPDIYYYYSKWRFKNNSSI